MFIPLCARVELLAQIENFIDRNRHLGYTTREEFIKDAARWRLRFLTGTCEYVEVQKEKYEKAELAIREMNLPFLGAADFIDKQLETLLEKHGEWQQQKEEKEKKTTKKR